MDTQPTKGTTTFTYTKYLETCQKRDYETLIKNYTLIDGYEKIWHERYKKCLKVIDDIVFSGIEDDTDLFARWLAFYAFGDFFSLPKSETGVWPMKWMNHTKELCEKFKNKNWDWDAECYDRCGLYEYFLQEQMADKDGVDLLLGEDLDYGKVFDFYLKSKKTQK